ncbi:MAG: hypothetical protein IPM77_01660 [Crocinitomicaceae bacterium]|nr:hypothetical protein [Crocinitomicaceae bacterium]
MRKLKQKALIFLPFVVLLISFQSSRSKLDDRLNALSAVLPEGWSMDLHYDTLKIYCEKPIWVLESNFINAPEMDLRKDERNQKRIVENGKKSRAEFVFLLKRLKGLAKAERNKANYLSTLWALYQVSAVGYDTPYQRVYPWKTEEEASHIYFVTLIDKLKAVTGPVYSDID